MSAAEEHRRRVRRRADRWANIINRVVFPLAVAAVVAVAAVLWQSVREGTSQGESIGHLVRVQTTVLQRLAAVEAGKYDRSDARRKHGRIWQTDRDQYDRLAAIDKRLGEKLATLRGEVLVLGQRLNALAQDHDREEDRR